MNEYKAVLDFNTVVACKKALKIQKAIIEASSNSAFELAHNEEFLRVCEALSKIEKNL